MYHSIKKISKNILFKGHLDFDYKIVLSSFYDENCSIVYIYVNKKD